MSSQQAHFSRGLGNIVILVLTIAVAILMFSNIAQAKTIATVNQKEITDKDFEAFRHFQNAKLLFDGHVIHSNPGNAQMQKMLGDLIEQEILYQEAGRRGIHISKRAITKKIKSIESKFSTRYGFRNALKQAAISEKQFREFLERGIAIQKLLHQEVFRNISVTPKQVRNHYRNHQYDFVFPETVRLGHILIKTSPTDNELKRSEAYKKIFFVKERLQQGDKFSVLAIEFSDGIERYKGGDTGYIDPNQLDPRLTRAVRNLKRGQVSPIVETVTGYHMLKVLNRKPAYSMSFDAVKEEIEDALLHEKHQKALASYLGRLKQQSVVTMNSIY